MDDESRPRTKHDGEIRIEQVSNGYVVSTTDFRSQRMSQTLAVFNHMSELAAWLAANFTIPTEPKP